MFLLRKSNLTYHTSEKTDLSVLLDAHTLLFVIPNNSRSLATMTLVNKINITGRETGKFLGD